MELTIHRTMQADKQFLMDILTTAVEGGIGYFCCITDLKRDEDLNVLSFEAFDVEDEEETFSCDLNAVLKGCQHVLDDDFEHEELAGYIMEQDGCNIDADFADIIVQLGMFGEVVYG